MGGGLGEAGLSAQSDDREKGLQKTEEAKRLMRLANKAYFTILFKADTARFQYEGSELTFRCRWLINKFIINSQEEIWPCVLFFIWESFPFYSLHAHPPYLSPSVSVSLSFFLSHLLFPLSLSLSPSLSKPSYWIETDSPNCRWGQVSSVKSWSFQQQHSLQFTHRQAFRQHSKHMPLFRGNQDQQCSELHFSKAVVHLCQQNGENFLSTLPWRASRCFRWAKVHLHQRLLLTAAARIPWEGKPHLAPRSGVMGN